MLKLISFLNFLPGQFNVNYTGKEQFPKANRTIQTFVINQQSIIKCCLNDISHTLKLKINIISIVSVYQKL